jgi:hypothetical protein
MPRFSHVWSRPVCRGSDGWPLRSRRRTSTSLCVINESNADFHQGGEYYGPETRVARTIRSASRPRMQKRFSVPDYERTIDRPDRRHAPSAQAAGSGPLYRPHEGGPAARRRDRRTRRCRRQCRLLRTGSPPTATGGPDLAARRQDANSVLSRRRLAGFGQALHAYLVRHLSRDPARRLHRAGRDEPRRRALSPARDGKIVRIRKRHSRMPAATSG